jgi:hypothetical protein
MERALYFGDFWEDMLPAFRHFQQGWEEVVILGRVSFSTFLSN